MINLLNQIQETLTEPKYKFYNNYLPEILKIYL